MNWQLHRFLGHLVDWLDCDCFRSWVQRRPSSDVWPEPSCPRTSLARVRPAPPRPRTSSASWPLGGSHGKPWYDPRPSRAFCFQWRSPECPTNPNCRPDRCMICLGRTKMTEKVNEKLADRMIGLNYRFVQVGQFRVSLRILPPKAQDLPQEIQHGQHQGLDEVNDGDDHG